MKCIGRIAVAALVASAFVAPAIAGEWVYHGGPKSPDSLSWYAPDSYYGYDVGSPYAAPEYGPGYRAPSGY